MRFRNNCVQKRFCEGNAELLRTVFVSPEAEEDTSLSVFFELCREIGERSFAFSESELFPSLCEMYRSLSPHDKKFNIPKYTYRVEIAAEHLTDVKPRGECIRMHLSAVLMRKGTAEFERTEMHYFAKREKDGIFYMIPPPKKAKKRQISSKNAE